MASVNVHDVHVDLPDTKLQLQDIETVLRKEAQNRVIDTSYGCPLYDCLAQCLNFQLERLPGTENMSNTFDSYRSDKIQTSVTDLLCKHKKQFQSVLNLLVENFPDQPSRDEQAENYLNVFFEKVITDLRAGRNLHEYTHLCLYAAATCVNTPIYIICRNEFGRSRWSYFEPLFTYEDQPQCVVSYVTMAMTSQKCFYKVETRDMLSVPRPNATGLVGMYLEVLEDISPLDIDVPAELLELSDNVKSTVCHSISRDIVLRSCILFLQRRLIQMDAYNKLTQHRAPRQEFCSIVTRSQDAYKIVCQVLVSRREKTVLTKFVSSWNLFVNSCDYLRQFESLAALDTAIYSRNVSVSNFVNSCQMGGQELHERRKNVTTAVIASSSVGIVSGGMVIAGLILAPFSFGASLGLSIAGGVIGAGSGVAAGSARAFEAVKQNSKMNDIKAEQARLQEKESDVANALTRTEELFRINLVESRDTDDEELGISRRGFFAVGYAVRATNSITHIALAAARLGTTAVTVSAAVLGPLSLVFDIAFLAEAAHNKAKGDKTNAGEILQSIAETIETKSKIFNSMLRGNLSDDERMAGLHR